MARLRNRILRLEASTPSSTQQGHAEATLSQLATGRELQVTLTFLERVLALSESCDAASRLEQALRSPIELDPTLYGETPVTGEEIEEVLLKILPLLKATPN